MRRVPAALLLIAWLQQSSLAQVANRGEVGETPQVPQATNNPWIDQGTSPVSGVGNATSANASATPGLSPDNNVATADNLSVVAPDHRLAASLTLGGIYAAFTTWTYFAWYRKHKPLSDFKWGGDGWLGDRTYAGGADKFGHAWATMGLGRAGTELLYQWGGFSRLTSTLVGVGLSELLFIGVEVKDGFYYEFSFSDFTGDSLGALAAVALSLSPRLDELFDFRVEYWPSHEYRRQFDGGNVNIAEDYSGETYLLALHLGAIHPLRDWKYGAWSQFVDVAVGYGTRGYKPDPPSGLPPYDHHQEISFGVTLNLQGVADWAFEGRSAPAKKIFHGLFEVFNFGYVPFHTFERTPTKNVASGGA
ncbi:MAG TPA: DUF2279 domain-containing protein [Kofleriaceae bacterium]